MSRIYIPKRLTGIGMGAKVEYRTGNIFHSDCHVIVNPVNLVGVMGAGLAKQFKDRFPYNFKRYSRWCSSGASAGSLLFIEDRGKTICNFPTKNHWKNPSDLELVVSSLVSLQEWLDGLGEDSIAIPPVGCGLGGLFYDDVHYAFTQTIFLVDNVTIEVYTP